MDTDKHKRRQAAAIAYLNQAISQSGMTATDIARKIGVSPSTINRPLSDKPGNHAVSPTTLLHVRALTKVPFGYDINDAYGFGHADPLELQLLSKAHDRTSSALKSPHNPDDNADYPASNVRGQMVEQPRDKDWSSREMVKVMGTGQGGDGNGFFEWNGEVIDHVKRPAGLAGRQRVFAIYVAGDSMYPAYRDGALIYIDANLKPRIGRDALIEMVPKQDGEIPRALVKRVVSLTADAIKVEQFNPPKTFTIKRTDIKHAYLVLEIEELVG